MRIRTLKPEILTDEKSAVLSDSEWRLFVSCIVMADDYGNFRSSPSFLHSQVFWASGTTIEASRGALETLARVSLVSLYQVSGQQYGHIAGWSKHQRVDHPGKPLCPPFSSNSRGSREGVAKVPESLVPDRDQDRDQEGDQEGKATSFPVHDFLHKIKVAIEREQPERGMWNPGPWGSKDARQFLDAFGPDLPSAIPEIERRILLFSKDKAASPWTVAKFAKEYNGIGVEKPTHNGGYQQKQAVYPILSRAKGRST
jgi:hypothetical protein